jgi:hypothetical protein
MNNISIYKIATCSSCSVTCELNMGCSYLIIKNKAMYSSIHVYDENIKGNKSPYMIRNIYYSNFHSCLRYDIIFWGGDSESNNIFKLQKKALQIICGVSYHTSHGKIFKDYDILTLSSLYILDVICFIK